LNDEVAGACFSLGYSNSLWRAKIKKTLKLVTFNRVNGHMLMVDQQPLKRKNKTA
jgi:hypothetical protein